MSSTPSPPVLPVEVVRQITALADRFEDAWQAGNAPPLESLLDKLLADARPELLRQLLRVECDHRQQQGRPVTAAEARHRFAALGPWTAGVLAGLGLDDTTEPLTLEITTGPHAGGSYQLAGHATCLIGRGPTGVQLVVDDPGMSRVHFLIEYNPPVARLADLRSKNGVYLNRKKIDQADLKDDDEIRAGTSTFRVRLPAVPHTMTVAGLPAPEPATHPSTASQFPIVIGYEILQEIGHGGMGVVYKARRVADGQLVAIKTVHPAVSPSVPTLGRFSREMAILQRLTHPHIVAFLETGESGQLLYFVMEYVEGESAATLVKRHGPFAPARVVALGCQLLEALAHAHLQGYVHRDVKPGNVLLTTVDGREVIKLADFGLGRAYQASAMSGITIAGTSGGTPGYMPPEQVQDFRAARPAADQYAAAATLYFLLTGQSIYEPAPNTVDLLMRILHEEPIPLRQPSPALPTKLAEVIRRALARDVRHRFPDVLAMREALSRSGFPA